MTALDPLRSFTVTRRFAAPPEAVFRAWTHPDHLTWFFNPTTEPEGPATVDLRVGGHWRQSMVIDDKTRYVTGGIYRVIVPNRKLVFSFGAVGGWPELDPDKLDEAPLATILLTPVDGGTRMDFRFDIPGSFDPETVAAMKDGWRQTLDRLVTRFADTTVS